ncbi:MAG: disulfide bond formation protein DsbA [Micavibrio sp.]|nr:disulfide bond formation protein DsbA [Micavibrio sp.]
MRLFFLALILTMSWSLAYAEDAYAPMLKDRVMGDPNAPITLVEHSSLTCPHCAAFHASTLKMIKEKLIDTGKAKLVFSDFPLNAPALQGSLIARCFTNDDLYFEYIDFLFETQENWAHTQDPRPYLAQNARLLGLSSEELDSCMKTEGYQDAFVAKVQQIREIKDVRSTPTIIIAETDEHISGNKPYAVFETAVDYALSQVDKEK